MSEFLFPSLSHFLSVSHERNTGFTIALGDEISEMFKKNSVFLSLTDDWAEREGMMERHIDRDSQERDI